MELQPAFPLTYDGLEDVFAPFHFPSLKYLSVSPTLRVYFLTLHYCVDSKTGTEVPLFGNL